jgi:hypothetical protein
MTAMLGSLDPLITTLRADGYTVIGPALRDEAMVLTEIGAAADLPHGWGVRLSAGEYRVSRRTDRAAFAHSAGPQSWKSFLHPARTPLWTAQRDSGSGFTVTDATPEPVRYAGECVGEEKEVVVHHLQVEDGFLRGGRCGLEALAPHHFPLAWRALNITRLVRPLTPVMPRRMPAQLAQLALQPIAGQVHSLVGVTRGHLHPHRAPVGVDVRLHDDPLGRIAMRGAGDPHMGGVLRQRGDPDQLGNLLDYVTLRALRHGARHDDIGGGDVRVHRHGSSLPSGAEGVAGPQVPPL